MNRRDAQDERRNVDVMVLVQNAWKLTREEAMVTRGLLLNKTAREIAKNYAMKRQDVARLTLAVLQKAGAGNTQELMRKVLNLAKDLIGKERDRAGR